MDDENSIQLAPGSRNAIARGCTCDPELNEYGAGVLDADQGGPIHRPHYACPLHGLAALARLLDRDLPDDPR